MNLEKCVFHLYITGIVIATIMNILTCSVSYMDSCPHNCSCKARTTLLCNYSQFQQVPFDLPRDAKILYLDQNNIHSIRPAAFAKLRNLTTLTLSYNQMDDKSIGPLSFKGIDSLDVLDLSYNGFSGIPNYIPGNISSLYIINNSILHLGSEAFYHMKYVNYLGLSYNQIYTIDSLAFSPLQNFLGEIDLSFNKLTCTGIQNGKIFAGLKIATILYLRFNPLGCIPNYLPVSLGGLDLVSIGLTQVNHGPLNHLKKLTNIALWQNSITQIEDNAFDGLTGVTLLDIFSNQIKEINNNTFKGMTNMVHMFLYSNAIEVIAEGAFLAMAHLEELWLSGNKLTTLTPGFLKTLDLPALDYVDLTFNPLKCDCKLRWLKIYQEHNDKIQMPHLMTCASPSTLKGMTWDHLSYKNFTCSL